MPDLSLWPFYGCLATAFAAGFAVAYWRSRVVMDRLAAICAAAHNRAVDAQADAVQWEQIAEQNQRVLVKVTERLRLSKRGAETSRDEMKARIVQLRECWLEAVARAGLAEAKLRRPKRVGGKRGEAA